MKKLLLFIFLLPTLAFAQLELPYSIKVVNPKPLDFWYFESDGTPYDNTGEVISQVLSPIRYRGMTFNVNGVEYWFGAGTADGDLVIKTADLSGYELLSNKATDFSTIDNDLYPTTQAVSDYVSGSLPNLYDITKTGIYGETFVRHRVDGIGGYEDVVEMGSSYVNGLDIGYSLLRMGFEESSPAYGVISFWSNDTGTFGYNQENFQIRPGRARFKNTDLQLQLNSGTFSTGTTYFQNSSGNVQGLPAGTNGHVLTLASGIPSWAAPSGGGLTVGTSTITSGTNTKVLYNNSGVLGEYTVSGTGNVAMTTSPTFTTPALGTPSALVGTNITGTATGLTSGITNALKSATTTVDVSAATAPTSGQVLTATSGTAATWQTPSASGAWLLASGGTATGTNTFAMGSNPFILTSGVTTGTGATAGIQNVFNSLTTGNGLDISSSSVSSGSIVKITGTGTAAASNTQSGLVVDVSGANATSTQTTYGGYFSNTHTGTSSKNIGLYAAASGGTNNYAIQADGTINLNNNQRLTWEANPSKAIWIQSNLMTLSTFGDFSFVTWGGASYAERFRISDTYTAIGGGTSATALRFLEPSGSGTNYSSFSAVAQSANINYSLPPTVAAAGAVLTDAAGNGVLTWEDKSLQSSTNTKTEKVIHNLGTIGSAATSTYSIHAESYYANGTTLLAKITVVAVKTDGSASAHSTVTARFRKNSSGTWSVDDAGTDITSDITILADVAGDFSTNPNVKVTMGAASGNYNVSWVAETIEVK